jgi:hypothetical protein
MVRARKRLHGGASGVVSVDLASTRRIVTTRGKPLTAAETEEKPATAVPGSREILGIGRSGSIAARRFRLAATLDDLTVDGVQVTAREQIIALGRIVARRGHEALKQFDGAFDPQSRGQRCPAFATELVQIGV